MLRREDYTLLYLYAASLERKGSTQDFWRLDARSICRTVPLIPLGQTPFLHPSYQDLQSFIFIKLYLLLISDYSLKVLISSVLHITDVFLQDIGQRIRPRDSGFSPTVSSYSLNLKSSIHHLLYSCYFSIRPC
jgi:hypothetical protein